MRTFFSNSYRTAGHRPRLQLLVLLLPLLLCAACVPAAPQIKPPAVFSTPTITSDVPAGLQGPGVRRLRAVGLNLVLFNETTTAQSTEMNFFPGVDLIVDWNQPERVEQPSGYFWTGKLAGAPLGQATLTISGANVTANITRGDGMIYQIRTAADGGWWVLEVDQRQLPRESAPVNPNLQ